MGVFEDVHGSRVAGSLAMFDRMIFKGHLSGLYKQDNARCFLRAQGVALRTSLPTQRRRRSGSPTTPASWRRTSGDR